MPEDQRIARLKDVQPTLPFDPPLEETATEAELADAPTISMPSSDALDEAHGRGYADGVAAAKKEFRELTLTACALCKTPFRPGMTEVWLYNGKMYDTKYCATVDN